MTDFDAFETAGVLMIAIGMLIGSSLTVLGAWYLLYWV